MLTEREGQLSQSMELDGEVESDDEKMIYRSENIYQVEESGGSSKGEVQFTEKQPSK